MATTTAKTKEETLDKAGTALAAGSPGPARTTHVADRQSAEAALQNASYQKSQAVQQAEQKLAEYQASQPGAYTSAYQQRIDGLLDQILNRGGFSYDFNADPLYQAYKDQYTHNGRLAMQDTMAAAQGATGGYASSYAVAAGSGAYQGYLNDLNGKLPALYETALKTYQQNGQTMQDSLSALTTQEKAAQAAYEDTVADYYKGLSAYSERADSAYKEDYGEYQDWIAALGDMRDYYAGQEQQSFQNQLSRQQYELALQKYAENVREWQAEQAAGREKWQAQLAQQQSEFAQQMAYKTASAARSGSSTRSTSSTSTGRNTSTGSTRAATSASAGSAAQSAKTQKKKADYIQQMKTGNQARMTGR